LRSRGLQLSSFKLKLVAYFVLLSLVPMAADVLGIQHRRRLGESRQVTLRQEAGLRAALALYAERAIVRRRRRSNSRAPSLQRALERR
jgi:hypothetical protein